MPPTWMWAAVYGIAVPAVLLASLAFESPRWRGAYLLASAGLLVSPHVGAGLGFALLGASCAFGIAACVVDPGVAPGVGE